MEKNCLVTTYKAIVDNNELLRLGEMKISVSRVENTNASTNSMVLGFDKPTDIEITGDGYFTDANYSANKGKIFRAVAGVNNIYFSNGDYNISIMDKYSLTSFDTSVFKGATSKNKAVDISSFAYCYKLTSLIYLDSNLTGDIDALSGLTSLTILNLRDCSNLTGDIAALSGLTSLTDMVISEKSTSKLICSNIGKLATLNNLQYLRVKGMEISGDLSTLSPKLILITNQNGNSNCTWSNRPSTSNVFAIEDINVNNIDKMLIDFSNCVVPSNIPSDSYYKVISVKGVRTSASDDAVAALQSKGYTIIIR